MKHHFGKFVWFEHMSQDVDKAREFYQKFLGWVSPAEAVGDQQYHMIKNGDAGVGGFRQAPAETPSHWFSYLSVADVDESAQTVTKLGAQVIMPPTDFEPVGRGCIFSDPQGAVLSAWRSSGGDREDCAEGILNDWCWNELMSTDAEASVQFYRDAFGYETEIMPMEGMGNYHVLKKDGQPRGGIMQTPQAEMGSHWMPYVAVEDCDTAAEKARELGAQIIMEPMDVPNVGRIAILQDPTGAVLGFMHGASA